MSFSVVLNLTVAFVWKNYLFMCAKSIVCVKKDTAPLYNISNLEVPVAMFHGTNDWLVAKTNIYKLQTEIPNLVFKKELEGWEHLDFIWAMDAPSLCYADVIRLFKEQLAAN